MVYIIFDEKCLVADAGVSREGRANEVSNGEMYSGCFWPAIRMRNR